MALLTTAMPDASVAAASQVRLIIKQQFQQLSRSGMQGYNAIWKNPKATPQQIITALGTDAAAVFKLAELNMSTLQSAATIGGAPTPSLPAIPAGYSVTFNTDGSATVTQAAVSPELGT